MLGSPGLDTEQGQGEMHGDRQGGMNKVPINSRRDDSLLHIDTDFSQRPQGTLKEAVGHLQNRLQQS